MKKMPEFKWRVVYNGRTVAKFYFKRYAQAFAYAMRNGVMVEKIGGIKCGDLTKYGHKLGKERA